MPSNIFKLNVKDVAGAVISAILSAVLLYVSNLTSLSNVDFQQILSIALTVGATSLLKALGTDREGSFGGVIKVK